MVTIRRFKNSDAKAVSEVVCQALAICNIKDYEEDLIIDLIGCHKPEDIINISNKGHFYVAVVDEKIVGCGSIERHENLLDSYISTVFIDPKYQNMGIGRKIIEALEGDDYFKNSKRCEVSASLTGEYFYKRLGYSYTSGKREINDFGGFFMEKFNEK